MSTRQLRAAARSLPLLFALAVLPAALQAQETQDTTKLPAQMRPIRASLNGALLALDAVKAATFFADNATVDFQGQSMQGRPAVEGWLLQAFQGVSAIRFGTPSFTVKDDEVSERNSYTVTTSDGATQPPGSTDTVWRRQTDGSWKVVRLIVL